MNLKNWLKAKAPKLYRYFQYKKAEFHYFRRKHTSSKKYPRELEKRYFQITGKNMDINNPETYSAKIQWLKLYDPNPLRTQLTDKVAVREWISKKIGSEYLIPSYGFFNHFDDINFNDLPNQFVIKTNHSSGWNLIVKDKQKFNKRKAKKTIETWLSRDYAFWSEFEIHYSPILPKIIIEKYMEDKDHPGSLTDYKFLCFNGKPSFVWVDFDRYQNHKRNVYDMNWKLQPFTQMTYPNFLGEVKCPENFDKMKELVTILCQGFIHVRVDLYNINGKIYFGEMTFTNGSGFEQLYPTEYEKIIGELIHLPISSQKGGCK